MQRRRVTVEGRVQGVYFRAHTKKTAESLGITGWVMNLPNGHVLSEIQGPREALDQMVNWLKTGPSLARVDKLEVLKLESIESEETSFQINK